jgi:predicted nucleic acid-binding protein
MVTFALDSSAILRYLDGEAGSERVAEVIKGHLAGRQRAIISAIHWGEIAGVTCKVHGRESAEAVLSRLSAFGLEVIPADGERAARAAFVKVETRIPYADAFGVELAASEPDCVLLTADFDLKTAAGRVKIEFLPKKA